MDNEKIRQNLEQIRTLLDSCLLDLGSKSVTAPKGPVTLPGKPLAQKLDFTMPIRAFIKRYAATGLNGQKKFVLLLAYLVKGDESKNFASTDIEKCWNSMKPLLGGSFNTAYSLRAKENAWVDSNKKGEYHLRSPWKEIFNVS